MTAPERSAAGRPAPAPGDLRLDPAVPEVERVTLSRNGWSAQVTHVWSGAGWVRLAPGPVQVAREVPAPVAGTRPPVARTSQDAADDPATATDPGPRAAGAPGSAGDPAAARRTLRRLPPLPPPGGGQPLAAAAGRRVSR